MRKRIAAVLLLAGVCLNFVSCKVQCPDAGGNEDTPLENSGENMRVRIISRDEDGFVAAGIDDEDGAVFFIEHGDMDGVDKKIVPGDVVKFSYDNINKDTEPYFIDKIENPEILNSEFNNLSSLYLKVFEDLWEEEKQLLSQGISYLGIDMSKTGISKSEKMAVAYIFAENHGAKPIMGTFEELKEAGYIDEENLYFKDGCLFSVREDQKDEDANSDIKFTAGVWMSGLCAYYMGDCTAHMLKNGTWSDYKVGYFAVS